MKEQCVRQEIRVLVCIVSKLDQRDLIPHHIVATCKDSVHQPRKVGQQTDRQLGNLQGNTTIVPSLPC
jgi:hypothetical protein